MQWIDLALIGNEDQLVSRLSSLSSEVRAQAVDQFLDFLKLSREEVEVSTLRILVERARGFALPTSLWSRPLYASSSVRDAGREHLESYGLAASAERLDAIQSLYQQFAAERCRTPVTEAALLESNYRCGHCGLAFHDEELESKGFASPYELRGSLKVDPFKPHWAPSHPNYRLPTMDHDWPVTTYGSNEDDNLRVLCGGCNEGKANFLSVEQMGPWSGLLDRQQLLSRKVSLAVFYVQIRRAPFCSQTGVGSDSAELTVRLRNPNGPAVLDNLMTVASPD